MMLKLPFIIVIVLLFSCETEAENSIEKSELTQNSTVQTEEVSATEKVNAKINSVEDKEVEVLDASNEIIEVEKKITPKRGDEAPPSIKYETKQNKVSSKAGDLAEEPIVEEPIVEEPKIQLHDTFNDILSEYVSASGKVNYKGLKSNVEKLDSYLELLQNNPVQNDWSRDKKLAYWINAYNAFTIKRIIDHYPLKSIMDLDNGKTWDVKWIKLGNETYSLNRIEHEIIRPQFNDARIHFAVNCAAKSCPPLYNKAYTEANVDSYLEKRTKKFINNNQYNSISADKIALSKIFEWYAEDFGDLINYLNTYSNISINRGATVNYKEYDWSLNE